jgi:ABC-type transport system involved in multi-copper enzyme maturation permease subunit
MFALLVIAWFGAGLISEDRRLGAHLLYFSRPITRGDYLLGKLCAASVFGALALVVPSLLICSVASFSSPNWSFLTEQYEVILAALGYSALWVFVISCLVLCVSSLVERKTLALATFVGWVMLTEACTAVLVELSDVDRFRWLSLMENFAHIANWMFDQPLRQKFSPESSLACVLGLAALCLIILYRRIRRLEVVA